ncbi:hypothetical protein ARMGADRAFT_538523 [Armillaria gallica]|uniref:Uncharacterized protein n=1 Tax=Armillaria gallica TaxID=47427 RepID=A0A2H3DFG1_ARMGA|nr:hypothetical protein ARMGADRAFT_538523 [Armillaria gallica]
MGYAPSPYDDSRRLSLKPSKYKTLRRRYHPYSRPDSVLFKPQNPLSPSNEIAHEDVIKEVVEAVDGPSCRWKKVLAALAALAIFLRIIENICRCGAI